MDYVASAANRGGNLYNFPVTQSVLCLGQLRIAAATTFLHGETQDALWENPMYRGSFASYVLTTDNSRTFL